MWQCNESEPAQWLRPDIENIWTVLAFFAPSALAVIALLIQYLLLHEPLAGSVPRDVNPVDVVILRWVRSGLQYLGFGVHSLDHTGEEDGFRLAFDQFMLGLGDIHAGFGVAIIGHALASLPRGLTAYDWWLTIGFGWAAVITNIAVLCSLRDYFRQNAAKRAWRLGLVFIMVAMLAVCMVPVGRIRHAMHVSGQYNGRDILAANVLCFFPGRGHGVAAKQPSRLVLSWGLIAGFLIVVAALSATVMVLEHPDGVLKRWCRRYWEELEEEQSCSDDHSALCARCEHRFVLLVMRPFIAFWLMVRAHLDVLGSALTEIVCSVALCTWVSLRFYELLQLHPLHITDRLTLVHYIAFATLLATLKPLVEHVCVAWRRTPRKASSRRWPWSRSPAEASTSPSDDDTEAGPSPTTLDAGLNNSGKSVTFSASAPPSGPVQEDMNTPRRRAMPRLPMHFKFYLDTTWYVAALPIAATSCLVQLVLMLVLSTMGGMKGVDVIFQLMPWFVVFAPVQVFLYIIAAMIAEERGPSSTRSRQVTFWLLSLGFAAVSTLAVADTIFGLGGWPMSYLGLAALGLMVVAHVLYGCVSKPGRLVKGKGVNTGTADEESALLGGAGIGNRNQPKIPVRRPKQLLPSRRLSKQGMKTYGTMMKPSI